MEELNIQLWELLKHQQKILENDLKLLQINKSYESSYDFPFLKNFSTWEELQSIIRFYNNRSFYLNQQQQKNNEQNCHPFGNMFDVIYSYYLPFMIFVGLVGNLLSCVVFLNTHLKMRSSSYYLAALACADFGFLASLFLVWLNGTLEVPIFNLEGYCQCIVYVSSVCSFLSVWLIAAFTVERYIAVQYPLHRPHMCTIARAKAIVFFLVAIALTIHTYVFITSGIIKLEDGSQVCEMLEGHREAMRIINIIDSILTLIAPLALIIIMNSMIIYNMIKFSKKFEKPGLELKILNNKKLDIKQETLGSITKSSSSNSYRKYFFQGAPYNSSRATSFRRLSQLKLPAKSKVSKDTKSDNHSLKEKRFSKIHSEKKLISTRSQQNITKMLLLISSVFVLLNLPSYGIRLYVFIFFSIWAESPPDLLWCLQQMFMILYYTNFSVNFLLYSMYGITFRRCLWQLVRKKFKKISGSQRRKLNAENKDF